MGGISHLLIHIKKSLQDFCLILNDLEHEAIVHPLGKLGWINLLILHGDEHTSLSDSYDLGNVFKVIDFTKIEIHVINSQIKGGPLKTKRIIDCK